jgi:threonine dehydrogenase-like Zn-dependent dehydrogenase
VTEVLASVVVGRKASAVRQFPLPEVPVDGGLLRVEAAGVCGSDVGSYDRNQTERVMGHENVGVIEKVGRVASERWGVKEGDRVALEEYLPCGHCRYCRTTEFRLCFATDPRMAGAVRYGSTSVDMPPALWGGYSQYLYLHPNSIMHKVPEGVPPEQLALALPLGNGYEWACVLGGAGPDRSVVVIGPGQQGLACVFAAKRAGAEPVVALGLGRDSERLRVARALGADATVNVEAQDAVATVRELTGGELADVVIDTAAGNAATLRPALAMLRHIGTLVLPTGSGPVDGLPIDVVRKKFLTVRGARGHSYAAVEWSIRAIASGKYPLAEMCTHRFGLDGVDHAIRAVGGEFGPDAIHVTIDPWNSL